MCIWNSVVPHSHCSPYSCLDVASAFFTNPEIICRVFIHTVEAPSGSSRDKNPLGCASLLSQSIPDFFQHFYVPPQCFHKISILPLRSWWGHTCPPQRDAVHPAQPNLGLCTAQTEQRGSLSQDGAKFVRNKTEKITVITSWGKYNLTRKQLCLL